MKIVRNVLAEELICSLNATDSLVGLWFNPAGDVAVRKSLSKPWSLVRVCYKVVARLVERNIPRDINRIEWKLVIGEVADKVVDCPEKLLRNSPRWKVPDPKVCPEKNALGLWAGEP